MALCRDCFGQASAPRARCALCGSPRLVDHAEIESLAVAHIDCDAFYASVEKRDDPSLRDRPVIVGGGARGVVSTCCYIARTFGVRSAMPMFQARALCRDAAIVKPDMAKYAAVGRRIRAMMLELTPLVEPLSIDEAFLDLNGTARLHGECAAATLARFASRVEHEIGVTVSVGLSYCKFLAKMASDIDKPRGFAVVGRAEAREFLAARPVGSIFGVGKVAEQRLARDGFRLIGDIQRLDETTLTRKLGAEGGRLWRLANGLDERKVSPERETKSVSAETTFHADISDPNELAKALYRLSEKVSRRLKEQAIAGRVVTLKLKTAGFKTRTRARTLSEPTQLAKRVFESARELLAKEATGERFRLVGVGLSDLHPPEAADLGDLVDADVGRDKATEAAMDKVRARFGGDAVIRGIVLGSTTPRRGKQFRDGPA